ncbi:WD40-repeat-containing domain protein [Fimicolochytrium jonesii]|uniref:WD40-repeat-containing domain protein n=1 Tax=Fimicolochytrium jonesii TaxID=1396493 RepID=UPI0022FE2D58|nr:WD40-repeat-containing domain protein [Fimicolochytrium jonesii]KAI8818420.1 WD40-repeat-containing domain protein [Fimicolochytrium jonesii]
MRVKTLQILWHDKQPIFSVDFEPNGNGRFATAGGDYNVRIWNLQKEENEPPVVQFVSSLNRHTEAVNCVRWSPKGGILASGGDDGTIFLWQKAENRDGVTFDEEDGTLETWRIAQVLRGATAEIYDLAWSPDAAYIISACINNTAQIFSVSEQKCIQVLTDHGHFVQGVAWDPLGQYLATQSSDRSVNTYICEKKKSTMLAKLTGRLTKLAFAKEESQEQSVQSDNKGAAGDTADNSKPDGTSAPNKAIAKNFRLFHDETLTSFFRRLTYTPDGSLLLAPAGVHKSAVKATESRNSVYVYGRGKAPQPLAYLPGHGKPSIAIRCSPVPYKLRKSQSPGKPPSAPSLFALEHRYIFAVGCQDALLIYDTQQREPIAYLSGLHYATLTDLAWSPDGCTLLITSTDGFCSVISFEKGELGETIEAPHKAAIDPSIGTPPASPTARTLTAIDTSTATLRMPLAAQPDIPVASKHSREDPARTDSGAPESKKRRIAPIFLGN